MASLVGSTFARSLVGLRCRTTFSPCMRSSMMMQPAVRLQSTQAPRPPLRIRAETLGTPHRSVHMGADVQLSSMSTYNWHSLFQNAMDGTQSIWSSGLQRKPEDMLQPSLITSPEESPIKTEWKHKWFLWTYAALISAMTLVCSYGLILSNSYNDSRLLDFMRRNFKADFSSNLKWWTFFTDIFYYENPYEMAYGFAALYFLVPPLLTLLGPVTFTALFLGSKAIGELSTFGFKKYAPTSIKGDERQDDSDTSSGSAGTFCLATTLAMLDSRSKMMILFIPINIRILLTMYLGGVALSETFYRRKLEKRNSSLHLTSLSGMLCGLVFWRLGLKGKRFA